MEFKSKYNMLYQQNAFLIVYKMPFSYLNVLTLILAEIPTLQPSTCDFRIRERTLIDGKWQDGTFSGGGDW